MMRGEFLASHSKRDTHRRLEEWGTAKRNNACLLVLKKTDYMDIRNPASQLHLKIFINEPEDGISVYCHVIIKPKVNNKL